MRQPGILFHFTGKIFNAGFSHAMKIWEIGRTFWLSLSVSQNHSYFVIRTNKYLFPQRRGTSDDLFLEIISFCAV